MKHTFLNTLNLYAKKIKIKLFNKKIKEEYIEESSDDDFFKKLLEVCSDIRPCKSSENYPDLHQRELLELKEVVCRHKDYFNKQMDRWSKLSKDEKFYYIKQVDDRENIMNNKELLKKYIEDLAKEYLKYFDKVEKSL